MRRPSSVYRAATSAAVSLGSIGGMTPAMKQNITRKASSMPMPDHAAVFSILTCIADSFVATSTRCGTWSP
jgi:hypothetical protein